MLVPTRPVDTGDRYIYYPCLGAVDTAVFTSQAVKHGPGSRVFGTHCQCSRAVSTGRVHG